MSAADGSWAGEADFALGSRARTEQRVAALFRAYWPSVYRRCRRLLGGDLLAEDAAQEVFLKVMTHLDELPPGEDASRWIHRVTSNYCFNCLRDEKRRVDARLDLTSAPPAFVDAVADRELVQRVIASLPGDVGLIGWLNHVDELNQGDIAERLNISRRTVVARLSTFNARARRVLRSL